MVEADLENKFAEAAKQSKDLQQRPSNDSMLQLYSLYKQATIGDANGQPPADVLDFVAKAKFEAWSRLRGKDKSDAMHEYIRLVDKLRS